MTAADGIVAALQSQGLLVLFFLAVVEGPIVTIVGGFLADRGHFDLVAVYVLVVTADLVGDVLCYFIGSFGLGPALDRWGERFGIRPQYRLTLERQLDSHAGKVLLVGKLTHSVGFVVLFAAGAIRMRLDRFVLFNLLGTLPKSAFFLAIGVSVGYAHREIDTYLLFGSIIGVVIAVTLFAAWFRHWLGSEDEVT